MNTLDIFFAALDKALQDKGLNQARLAELTGLQSTFISRIRKGHSRPGVEVLEKIAAALGYDLVDFLFLGRSVLENEKPPVTPATKAYLAKAQAILEGPKGAALKVVIDSLAEHG